VVAYDLPVDRHVTGTAAPERWCALRYERRQLGERVMSCRGAHPAISSGGEESLSYCFTLVILTGGMEA
jgi:hypothetical protein